MLHTTANCGHPTVAVGAPASLARRYCEANLCFPCSREPWPPVLFLDVDGVMNDHRWDPEVASGVILDEHVARLNRVLLATGAKIVLSSAWRYIVLRGESTLSGIEWLFRSHGILANRLLGITGPDTIERCVYRGEPGTWPRTNERGQQIADWLREHPGVTRYAVVDDIDLGISESGHPFVRTDGKVGLTDTDADQLIQILNGGQP